MRRTLVIAVVAAVGLLALPQATSAYTVKSAGHLDTAGVEAALAQDAARVGVPIRELADAYACLANATKGDHGPPEDLVDLAASVELTAGANGARRAAAVKAMCDLVRASAL
jgi:hypothetical protein